MELSLLQWLFQGIPECLALVALAIVLAGKDLEVKGLFLIGLPHAVAIYCIRLLSLSFGVHFIIIIIVLAALLSGFLKIKFSRSLLTALTACIILAAAEVIFVGLIYSTMDITFEQAKNNLSLWILTGLPHVIFIFFLALVIGRWRKKISPGKEGFDA